VYDKYLAFNGAVKETTPDELVEAGVPITDAPVT
jgi:hypothetical protein